MKFDIETDIIPTLPWAFENEEKQNSQKTTIFYFSLTTCAYCKKGKKWLNEKGVAYNWLFIDKLDLNLKQEIKKWIQTKYKLTSRMASPFVIFRKEGKDFISNGYDPEYWKSKA